MTKALSLPGFWSSNFSKTKITAANNTQGVNWGFFLAVTLIVASVVLLASYIYGVNAFAQQGYEIESLQKRLKLLNDDNKKINLKVSEASSMVMIQSDFLSSSFVPAGTPKFVEVNNSQFTQK